MIHVVYVRHFLSVVAITTDHDGNIHIGTGFTQRGADKDLFYSIEKWDEENE